MTMFLCPCWMRLCTLSFSRTSPPLLSVISPLTVMIAMLSAIRCSSCMRPSEIRQCREDSTLTVVSNHHHRHVVVGGSGADKLADVRQQRVEQLLRRPVAVCHDRRQEPVVAVLV